MSNWRYISVIILILIWVYTLAWIIGMYLSPAIAHTAPSGLTYSAACCSSKDCHYMPHGVVRITADGYLVLMPMEGHPVATDDIIELIPYGDRRVKFQSDDEFYHVCLNTKRQTVRCLYVPEMMG